MLRGDGRVLEPLRGEDAQLVAVAEEQHVAVDGLHTRDHALRTDRDIVDRLTAHNAVAKERPSRPLLLDLSTGPPLKLAVVPLDEIRIDHRAVRKAGELARLARPAQRTHKHGRECESGKTRA